MGKESQHVVPNRGKWSIRKAGSSKASKTFKTQKEAIENARTIAIKQKAELFIHGKDGRIREKNSYGNDKYPPKG